MSTGAKQKILFIADDNEFNSVLSALLIKTNYKVENSPSIKDVLNPIKWLAPDLLLININNNDNDLVDLCHDIRNLFHTLPIFIITGSTDEYFHVALYEAGINDLIIQPKMHRLVIHKIGAVLKTIKITAKHNSPDIVINSEKFLVEKNGEEIILPRKEFEIFSLLTNNPNKVFTREEIVNSIWKNSADVNERLIDVHIRKLREKIGDRYVRTIKNMGYTIGK